MLSAGVLILDRFKQVVFWLGGIILLSNFYILMRYGDTLMSTHLFIVRGTVFYPVAGLNLIAGVLVILLLIRDLVTRKRT